MLDIFLEISKVTKERMKKQITIITRILYSERCKS